MIYKDAQSFRTVGCSKPVIYAFVFCFFNIQFFASLAAFQSDSNAVTTTTRFSCSIYFKLLNFQVQNKSAKCLNSEQLYTDIA